MKTNSASLIFIFSSYYAQPKTEVLLCVLSSLLSDCAEPVGEMPIYCVSNEFHSEKPW